jgi:hypothetical protein
MSPYENFLRLKAGVKFWVRGLEMPDAIQRLLL